MALNPPSAHPWIEKDQYDDRLRSKTCVMKVKVARRLEQLAQPQGKSSFYGIMAVDVVTIATSGLANKVFFPSWSKKKVPGERLAKA